jgi:tRNA(Ile)-lysidine synthetase-like protein
MNWQTPLRRGFFVSGDFFRSRCLDFPGLDVCMGDGSGAGKEERLVQRVRASWRRIGLTPGSPVLVGFSGGRDSIALLAALRPVVRHLHAVHVDHGVRPESSADAERAVKIAGQLDVPIIVKRLEPDIASRHPGVGLEEALRRERYRAFADAVEEISAKAVALGHHLRDQAETVLLHLLRGSGLSGAVGMQEMSFIEVGWWTGYEGPFAEIALWRPFLDVDPGEIEAFVARLGVEVIEDPSNEDRRFRRNAIRHEVLPMLERVVPGATGNLARFGSLVVDDDNLIELLANELVGRSEALERDVLLDVHVALQRRVIRNWLRRRIPAVEISRERVEAVLDALRERRGPKRIEIGGGYSVLIDREAARIVRAGHR